MSEEKTKWVLHWQNIITDEQFSKEYPTVYDALSVATEMFGLTNFERSILSETLGIELSNEFGVPCVKLTIEKKR